MNALFALERTAEDLDLIERINKRKKEKDAVVLVHNYQRDSLYDIADFTGDSLWLSRKAAETRARLIIFNGVYFMAETAKILNPEKKVVIPVLDAGCSLAESITADALREFKAQYPDAKVVVYVNTYADVKAESDGVCTSANAVEVVRAMPSRRVIFGPDHNLASWVAEKLRAEGSDKEVIPWNGYCEPHRRIRAIHVEAARAARPRAKVIAHPECNPEVLARADYVCGTQRMIEEARKDPAEEFILATETNMIHMLEREIPGKRFYSVGFTCIHMMKNRLPLVLKALEDERPEVEVTEDILRRARRALDVMLEVGPGKDRFQKCITCT